MLVFPNVKINIGLSITSKRPDGYHNIESIFYPVPWTESLEVTLRDAELSFSDTAREKVHITEVGMVRFLAYGQPIPGDPAKNLCVRVYQLLEEWYQMPEVDIHLWKQLPIGAGLGGGSADAAFTLKALVDYLELRISDHEAKELLAKVGSDCPFFWKNEAAFVYGRGEQMRSIDLDLSAYHILLVHPGIHISTQEAYSGVTPQPPMMDLELLPSIPVEQWKEGVVNDFEAGLFKAYPILSELKQSLYDQGAAYASMTGSGSALYGLFKEAPEVPKEWRERGYLTWSGALTL